MSGCGKMSSKDGGAHWRWLAPRRVVRRGMEMERQWTPRIKHGRGERRFHELDGGDVRDEYRGARGHHAGGGAGRAGEVRMPKRGDSQTAVERDSCAHRRVRCVRLKHPAV